MSLISESMYFGFVLSLGAYLIGAWLKKKLGWAILNPLLVAVVLVIAVLLAFRIDYGVYNNSARYITTAIGMGVSEEAGGIVTITVVCIIITGIFGNIFAEILFKLIKVKHPIAKGLALGTSAHAIGTAKALELGEIEGAMSSLSIAVAGLMTVVVVPLAAKLL